MKCNYPGCTKPVFPGSLYCSRSHRDASTGQTCRYPGCVKPCYPGGQFCSRSHRDNASSSSQNSTGAARSSGTGGLQGRSDRARQPIPTRSTSPPASTGILEWLYSWAQYLYDAVVGTSPPDPDEPRSTVHASTSAAEAHRDHPSRKGHTTGEIKFYDRNAPYYEFTNFAYCPVSYEGKSYPTSEHLFQSLKFTNSEDAELIRIQRTPRDAFNMAKNMRDKVRPGWIHKGLNVRMMEKVIQLKFTQSEKLKQMLVSTGDAKLIEDSPIDPFWGIGADGKGANKLGEALMKVRSQIRRGQY